MNLSELRQATDHVLDSFCAKMSLEEMKLPSQSVDDLLKASISASSCENKSRLEQEFWGQGPLSEILCDTKVTEIIVNGPRQIWYERASQWIKLEDEFLSQTTFKNWVHRIGTEAGVVFDLNHAFANGRWRDFRIHLACSPLVQVDFHLSLRRHASIPWSFDRLKEHQWANEQEFQVLQKLIDQKSNLLFIGPTGCGKTSVLSACLNSLPPIERVVLLEDTDELPLPNSASTKLLTREDVGGALQPFDLTALVKQSLRMRPQRLVVGEVRGGEAKDLLLALATGHHGSFGTLHATTAKQALLRLEMLVQIGAPQWNTQTIRQLIALSIDHIVVCGYAQSQRRLQGVFKLASLETCGFLLEPVL